MGDYQNVRINNLNSSNINNNSANLFICLFYK